MEKKDSSKITFRSKFTFNEGNGHKRIELYIQKEANFKTIRIDERPAIRNLVMKLYSQ